jgi:hypothetical protein
MPLLMVMLHFYNLKNKIIEIMIPTIAIAIGVALFQSS